MSKSSSKENYIKKAVLGTANLSGVGVLAKLVGIVGAILLARWLTPQDFGVFAVVGFVLHFLKLANDLGFAVSIIRTPQELSQNVKSSIFFFQLILALGLSVVLILLLPLIPRFYSSFNPDYNLLVYAMLVEVFLNVTKSVPKAILTREINFKPIAYIEMTENFSYWVVALVAAYLGCGVWSLATAVLFRTALGTMVFWWVSPWRPSLRFHWSDLRGHLKFGFEYQLMRIFDFARTAISPTLISGHFGVSALGIVGWATQMTRVPQFIVFSLDQVGLPLYSRLQDEKKELKKVLENVVEFSFILMTPLMLGLVIFANPLIHFVFTDQWIEGQLVLQILAFYFIFWSCSLPLSTCIFSLGHARYLLFQGIVLFASELTITLFLMKDFGFESIAIAQCLVGVVNFFVLTFVIFYYRGIFIDGLRPLLRMSGLGLFVFLLFRELFQRLPQDSLVNFVVGLLLYGVVWLAIMLVFFRKKIVQAVRLVRPS